MKNLNMSQLFDKLNDVKVLFQYGQKVVPVLQSLVDFMQETVPLLENINHSIADSTAKIPKASDQINNVTNATELATTEILDLVDAISNNVYSIEKKLETVNSAEAKKAELVEKLKAAISGNSEALRLLDEYTEIDSTKKNIDEISQLFPKIKEDSYNITLSLQVQDITSQQLAAVDHLIESVQDKLASLIQDIDDTQIEEFNSAVSAGSGIQAPEGATFDPNASYNMNDNRQDAVDAVINMEKASQAEIDKLFS
ncbi:MAG TPA: protein phosphatase CheZ [Ignavibacteriales bacterium]|nr:protein phosphatase CheZ [Ignavibacteriales bacterium]